MNNAIRALMVTPDASVAGIFAEISREVGIEAHAIDRMAGFPEELHRAKYEAVLLDFDTVPNANTILASLRQHPSNRNAVVFALATDITQGGLALQNGANLRFERPFEVKRIRLALHAAYDLMARERRRYFRCAAKFPVLLVQTSSGTDFKCTSINISSSGIALTTPLTLAPGDEVQLMFSLPGSESLVRALGTVIWDDKHGKTGLSFRCTSSGHQADLDSWLDLQLQNSKAADKNGNEN